MIINDRYGVYTAIAELVESAFNRHIRTWNGGGQLENLEMGTDKTIEIVANLLEVLYHKNVLDTQDLKKILKIDSVIIDKQQ